MRREIIMACPHGERTVRELGGEIWAGARRMEGADQNWRMIGYLVEVIMGVLARHAGKVIVNDTDLPVEPLPPR